jgi:hypothetical protein
VGELAEQLDREPPHTTTTTSSSASASGVGGGVWPSSTKWPFLMQVIDPPGGLMVSLNGVHGSSGHLRGALKRPHSVLSGGVPLWWFAAAASDVGQTAQQSRIWAIALHPCVMPPSPPLHCLSHGSPTAVYLQVAGSHLQGSVAGWWLGGTRLALAEPAAATWTATPQLFR